MKKCVLWLIMVRVKLRSICVQYVRCPVYGVYSVYVWTVRRELCVKADTHEVQEERNYTIYTVSGEGGSQNILYGHLHTLVVWKMKIRGEGNLVANVLQLQKQKISVKYQKLFNSSEGQRGVGILKKYALEI